MRFCKEQWLLLGILISFTGLVIAQDDITSEEENPRLELVEVTAQRVANLQPASTYQAPVTSLRFDPQIDVQARGLPEGQADITIRGGLFENTGFKIGAVTIFDPQTGHYAVELPIDQAMLTQPDLMTDTQNALNTFNASVATLAYGYADIVSGGAVRLGVGSDALRYASARFSRGGTGNSADAFGLTLAAAASDGDGTLPFGDHEFKRFSGHFQHRGQNGDSNIIIGYQDKFFGWPGAYTGFASLPETDHIKQGLVVIDHHRSTANGWWQVAAAYRWLDDDYDFDRRTVDTGGPGSFEHETRSFSLGLSGSYRRAAIDWDYSVLLAADRLVRSTDLVNGNFNSRTYLALRLVPGRQWLLDNGDTLRIQAGLGADLSNRDESALVPIAGIRWTRPGPGGEHSLGLELTRSTQVPGYTALNSGTTGLFGGNPDLGREYADTFTLSYDLRRENWLATAAMFLRKDDDLVDWTFSRSSPFARQANAVDLDVRGLEFFLQFTNDHWRVIAGYTYLDKDADYGDALVDASYYALNFARHRATLALEYKPVHWLNIRLDNEYRRQEDNILRNGDNTAWLASGSIGVKLPTETNLGLDLVVDNLTDSDFQEFPGTPAYGRQISLVLGLTW